MAKRIDSRPICNCSAYPFPHKIGGKCTGAAFTEFYYYNIQSCCRMCNCNSGSGCDVANGAESIKYAECYQEAQHYSPGEHLPIKFEDIAPDEPEYDI